MKELNVPVLNVFEASYLSADQHPFSDAIHYSTGFNKLILSSFYKGGAKEIELVRHQDADTSRARAMPNTRCARE
jgi:hypothetical protein